MTSRKTRIGCAVAIGLAIVLLLVALLAGGRGRSRARVEGQPTPPAPPTASQALQPTFSTAPTVATPPISNGPFEVDEEAVGFVSEAGYDYPDQGAGNIVCPKPTKSVRVYAIARAPEDSGGNWVFVASTACTRPSWVSSASWLQDDPRGLPKVLDLPSLRWPDPSALPKVEKAVGVVEPSTGDSVEGRPEPGRRGEPTCMLPKGSEVEALARVSDGSLDVAVRAPSCGGPVWIWMTEVKWKGIEWYALDDKLPTVRATLASPLRPPTVASAASTTPAAAPSAKPNAPARVFVRDTKGREHPWHRALPEAWRAESPEDAALVATVKRTPEMLETCSYIPMGVVYRVRPDSSITLSLDDRSRVVARTTLRGEAPAGCPGSVSVTIGGSGGTDPWQIGAEPSTERVISWLQPFALGSR